MYNRTQLSDYLKLVRNEHGLSQRVVAETIHVGRSTYSHYENARFEPSIDLLYLLADFYKMPAEPFLELASGRKLRKHPPGIKTDFYARVDDYTEYNAFIEHYGKKLKLLESEECLMIYYFHSMSRSCRKDIISIMKVMKENHILDNNDDHGTTPGDGTIWKKQ